MPLRCPRDAADLLAFTLDGITTDACPRCRGVWLDASELARVTSNEELERLAHAGASPSASTLACPRCASRLASSRIESVEVDPCPSCKGVWLDAGELRDADRQVLRRRWTERRGGIAPFASQLAAPKP